MALSCSDGFTSRPVSCPRPVGSGLKTCSGHVCHGTSTPRALRLADGMGGGSMNPPSLGGHHDGPNTSLPHPVLPSTTVSVGARPTHPEAEAPLSVPRRIDGPAAATQFASDLLRHHRDDVTLAIYLDERHRLVGSVILAVGWVQAARLLARPILCGAQSCRARAVILVRYGRCRALSATEPETRSFRSLEAACYHHGLPVVDHLVVAA